MSIQRTTSKEMYSTYIQHITTTKALCSLNVSLKEAIGRGYNL